MADEKRVTIQKEILTPTPKEGAFDITEGVDLETTDSAPFHSKGEKIRVSKSVADKMKANGWAK